MNPFPLVVAEFRRNWLGSAAVIALIATAVALGVALSAQEGALRQASARAADRFDLVVGAPGGPTQLILTTVYLQPAALDLLPAAVLERLQGTPGTVSVAPVAVADSYDGHPVVGTTADFATDGGRIAVVDGRRFSRADEALVGSAVDLPMGTRVRPAHGSPAENIIESHEHGHVFTVVGRLAATASPWDRAIIVPIEGVWAMHDQSVGESDAELPAALGPPWQSGRIGPVPAIVVKPRTVADAYRLRSVLRGRESIAVFPAEVLTQLYAVLGSVGEIVAALSLALDLLLVATVLLVVTAVLAARRPAIGALRALGAPPMFVFATIWLYSAALVSGGVAIGFAGGAILAQAMGATVGARFGIDVVAVPGAHEAALAAMLLVAGSILAVLPSLTTLRAPVRRLLQAP